MKFLLLSVLIFFQTARAEDKSFVIIIPSYNNKEHYEENLRSVYSQKYDKYRVIYIDDASPDGTGALVEAYIKEGGFENRTTVIRNEKRVFAMANIYRAVWLCKPDEIVVDLDGDDRLAHDGVLNYLNNIYANDQVWLTYGNWKCYPSGVIRNAQAVPLDVIEKNAFRSHQGGGTTHLRTFYAGLFHQIKREDFFYNGEFVQVTSDLAFMFPLLELAGFHSQFTPEILYIYYSETPYNDHYLRAEEQIQMDQYLRSKEKYLPAKHYKLQESNATTY